MSDLPTYTVADTKPLTGSVGMAVTGATGAVHVKLTDGTVVNQPATWTDEATGAFSMDWPVGGVPDAPGTASVEVQATFTDGSVQTVAGSSVRIRQQLA